jgi:hypothetical protein
MDQKTQATDLGKKGIDDMEPNAYHFNKNCRGRVVGSFQTDTLSCQLCHQLLRKGRI